MPSGRGLRLHAVEGFRPHGLGCGKGVVRVRVARQQVPLLQLERALVEIQRTSAPSVSERLAMVTCTAPLSSMEAAVRELAHAVIHLGRDGRAMHEAGALVYIIEIGTRDKWA